ncbi:MAG: hypothetical protein R2911_15170 [Caldilineaceae bacterium]
MAQWTSHAEFMLVFENMVGDQDNQIWQTRVWSLRVGENECDKEIVFAGLEPGPWIQWIWSHAQLTKGSVPVELETSSSPIHTDSNITSIEITEVQVSEDDSPAESHDKYLTVVVHFRISGEDATMITDRAAAYQVDIFTISQSAHTAISAGSVQGHFQPRVYEYTSRHNFPVPNVGKYALECIVVVSPPYAIKTTHRGPSIKVIP